MRSALSIVVVCALALAGCTQDAATPPPIETAVLETFEDGGCLGHLLLQRNAVVAGTVQGDETALTAAIDAWRAAALQTLSADELAQYEASSFAVQDDATPDVLATQAAACIATAPTR